jgi:hypothetical protein
MLSGSLVRPKRWSNVVDLYDDGEFSAVWGDYLGRDGKTYRCVGTRWNGDEDDPEDIGYPLRGAYPVWYCEPDLLAIAVLERLLEEVKKYPRHGNVANIRKALALANR